VELTLTRRDQMGFRMLLGRQALRKRFTIDPGRSYITGRPPRAARIANRTPTHERLSAEHRSGG
ncbi:MAG TPA: hypothetical protein EYM59_05360, partial [Acidimicrobiia bacterium]|nr:hypothetical protein [Acidimicrobiia bacterium]